MGETPIQTRCVVLSAPGGSGKSTLCGVGYSRMLAAWGHPVAAVDTDVLYAAVDPCWELEYSDERNAMVLEQAVGLVRSLARHGWPVVVVTGNSVHDPADTAPLLAALAPETALHHITLRVREEVLLARCTGQTGRDLDRLRVEHRVAAARPLHPGTALLDTSDLDVQASWTALANLVHRGGGLLSTPSGAGARPSA